MRTFLLILIILLIQNNSQIIIEPIILIESQNPFVLSSFDNYYYVITSGKSLQIEKETGNIINSESNNIPSSFINIVTNSNDNFVYYSGKYYEINYNPFISFNDISMKPQAKYAMYKDIVIKNVGSIALNDDFVIYGYSEKLLIFSSKSRDNFFTYSFTENFDEPLSCKFIKDQDFICAMNINSKLILDCFKYNSLLDKYGRQKSLNFNSISIFGLYDTGENNIKLLCKKSGITIQCNFLLISFEDNKSKFDLLEEENIKFTMKETWSEKNCYFSVFKLENLFCCGITDNIVCFSINSFTHRLIKEFKISVEGINSFLTIKNNNGIITLFFMNNKGNKNYVNEIYINAPVCKDKNYYISNNSLNENKSEENKEKLSNLILTKENISYYLEFDNSYNKYGYFTLNNTEIFDKQLILSNQSYIFDFIANNSQITSGLMITINYFVSIELEDGEIYPKQCQFNLQFKTCFNSCETCSVDYINSNTEEHNCLKCRDNYYKSPEKETNCYLIEEKKTNWYFDYNNSMFGLCNEKCITCEGPFNCSSCKHGLYLNNGKCLNRCPDGYVPNKISIDSDYYYLCIECFQNCENYSDNILDNTDIRENEDEEKSESDNAKECDISCSLCDEKQENNCLECNKDKGYYPTEESNSDCYNNETITRGYYLDTSNYLWMHCYEKCETCNSQGNNINMNCLSCKTNDYKNMKLINGNCIEICLNNTFITPNGECVFNCPIDTYKFSLNNSCLESCPHNYEINNNECIFKSFSQDITLDEFKNQISNDIVSYINSSKVINGSNFLAVVLTSEQISTEEQLNNGISAVDLGNCTNVIKDYYNISKEDPLIILNMESKNEKIQKNESISDDKSFNLAKTTQLEVYDYSGRRLNLSVCQENIKVLKYIGDVKELDIDSAKGLSELGIDAFNAADEFFNDICHQYENKDGKDIILTDRRNDIYQNATFCQDGCTYNGINYDLMAANCLCNSNLLQEQKNNIIDINTDSEIINFKAITKSFIENLFNFNFDIIKCYNLALNPKILLYNIGFYSLASMFVLQLILFFIYLIKKIKPLKIFMLIFKFNKNKKVVSKISNTNTISNQNKIKNIIKSTPPPKNNNPRKKLFYNKRNRKKYIKRQFNPNHQRFENQNKDKNKEIINKSNSYNLKKIEDSSHELNQANISRNNTNKNVIISNNYCPIIKIKATNSIIENSIKEENDLNIDGDNNDKIYNIKSNKKQHINNKKGKRKFNNVHIMDTLGQNNSNLIQPNNNKGAKSKLSKTESDIQGMDYEEAIIYDKRSCLRMYWGFLVDSQIILGTFCTDNHLDLFVIKLSFLVCTFQISFFLNAFFYTDEYISDAYHNDGVLDFFSGLPKSIYSFIATLITTNLLRMLSSSKTELMRVIKRRKQYKDYVNIINIKLTKLRKKLIAYFILVFSLESFFLYYVAVFCAVYKYSQKYWFLGCLESFGIDSFVALITCIFLALLRNISIKTKTKCLFIFTNIISMFL